MSLNTSPRSVTSCVTKTWSAVAARADFHNAQCLGLPRSTEGGRHQGCRGPTGTREALTQARQGTPKSWQGPPLPSSAARASCPPALPWALPLCKQGNAHGRAGRAHQRQPQGAHEEEQHLHGVIPAEQGGAPRQLGQQVAGGVARGRVIHWVMNHLHGGREGRRREHGLSAAGQRRAAGGGVQRSQHVSA